MRQGRTQHPHWGQPGALAACQTQTMLLGDAGSWARSSDLGGKKANTVAETTVLRQIKALTQKLNVSSGSKNGPDGLGTPLPVYSEQRTSQAPRLGPFGAMCGRLRVGKSFFHVLQHWSVQPCVQQSAP